MSNTFKKNISVRESFVREIESRILSGELKAGDRLPTARELCTQMGVSLTVVNAGVAELAYKGFVEVKPRHGVYVADYKTNGNPAMMLAFIEYNGGRLNAHDVRCFCETRLALDPVAAELAIRRAGEKEIEEWEAKLEQLQREEDTEKFCVLVTEFYHKLYLMTDNPLIAMYFHSAMEPQQRMYRLFINKNGRDPVLNNAAEIVRLVKAKDAVGAARLMREDMRLPLEGETAIVNDNECQ